MKIYFKSRKMEKVCNSEREIIRAYGAQCGRKLQQRLEELRAACSLAVISNLPPPRCHEMEGDRDGQLSVDLLHPQRLFFIPANDPIPRKQDGGLDWSLVTEIKVVEIEDPH